MPVGADGDEAATGDMTLVAALQGHKNKNWPIKCSFFHGDKHQTPQQATTKRKKQNLRQQNRTSSTGEDCSERDSCN